MGQYNEVIWKSLQTMMILGGCGESGIKIDAQVPKREPISYKYRS